MYMYYESVTGILYYTTYYTCIIEKLNAMLIVNVKNKQCIKTQQISRLSVLFLNKIISKKKKILIKIGSGKNFKS